MLPRSIHFAFSAYVKDLSWPCGQAVVVSPLHSPEWRVRVTDSRCKGRAITVRIIDWQHILSSTWSTPFICQSNRLVGHQSIGLYSTPGHSAILFILSSQSWPARPAVVKIIHERSAGRRRLGAASFDYSRNRLIDANNRLNLIESVSKWKHITGGIKSSFLRPAFR